MSWGPFFLWSRTRKPQRWLEFEGITRHNLRALDISFPLGVLTTVTGVSCSGKSSLVSQALVELVSKQLGHATPDEPEEGEELERAAATETGGRIRRGMEQVSRLVRVDQKPWLRGAVRPVKAKASSASS